MSVNYSACLMVGVPHAELGLDMDEIDKLDLQIFYPYYDARLVDTLVGVSVFQTPDYGYTNLPEKYKLEEAISIAFAKFLAKTDKIGKLYLTVDST